MDRYSRAKIYRLVGGGKTYYGSTCLSLSRRMAQHRANYKQFINGKRPYILTSFELLEEPDLEIVLVEEYPCENKEQLGTRERWWIENNECVNRYVPTRTQKEWRSDNKERMDEVKKNYYNNNKDKMIAYHKAYHKKYSQTNKDKINEQRRGRRLNVKIDKIFGLYQQEE